MASVKKIPNVPAEPTQHPFSRQLSLSDPESFDPPARIDAVKKFLEMDIKSRQDLNKFLINGEFEDNSVTGDNVYQYLEIAQSLQYEKLISICEDFLVQQLNKQRAVSMFLHGTTYRLQYLRKEATTLIEMTLFVNLKKFNIWDIMTCLIFFATRTLRPVHLQ